MPELAILINADLKRGLTVARVWRQMVYEIGLRGMMWSFAGLLID